MSLQETLYQTGGFHCYQLALNLPEKVKKITLNVTDLKLDRLT